MKTEKSEARKTVGTKNIELMAENVQQALDCAAIVYAPKDLLGINCRPEHWFFDLDLLVGKKMVGCSLTITVEPSLKKEYWVDVWGFSDDSFIEKIPDKEMTDGRAKEILCNCARKFLDVVAQKGLYRKKDEDGDFQWHIGKVGKGKNVVLFHSPRLRPVLNNGTAIVEGWRIIQNPWEAQQ